ncbi:MAG: hypothetical protein JSR64_02930 [Nitrospira sp.]|uniref:tetratricopeptide repeat protein n=1 Tax=Thauera sp. 2A1 TaxID=2570191 RepID=UPI001D17A41B|nr:tetratricopeptide repeat protein [Thauera sp. 2A1]KAI5916668.1 tetratricopeptide repeat protein [Thauera sp. 2A1]MBS0172969.1 hypothetical protein [Nitrospira sp.]
MRIGIFRNLAVLAAAGLSAQAYGGTEADYQALRSWCVQRSAHENDTAWQAANSPLKYFHFHHYCFAMKVENKLIAPRDAAERKRVVDEIVGQISYVVSHVQPDHFLLPEAYALRGRALYVGKRNVEAESDLLRALQLDPRHTRAAAQLATLYMNTNRRSDAANVVRATLELMPGDYRLRPLAKELKIELPPERPPQAVEKAPIAPPSEAADNKAPSIVVPPSDSPEPVGPAEAGVETAVTGCRFCPPEEIQSKWRESFREKNKQ